MEKQIEEGKLCAALSYLIVGIIWYSVDEKMKKNEFVKYHVSQSLGLLILSVAVFVVGSIIPILGWLIILPLGSILTLILLIIGMLNAFKGEKKLLPLIGDISAKKLKI